MVQYGVQVEIVTFEAPKYPIKIIHRLFIDGFATIRDTHEQNVCSKLDRPPQQKGAPT
jgi:hypothetical protein